MKNINSKEHWDHVYLREMPNQWREYPETRRQILQTLKDESKNISILELGCGLGVLAKDLQDYDYTGIDGSSVAIDHCKRTLKGNFQQSMIPPIPFDDNIFDIVIAAEFLEHFHYPERIVSECKRVGVTGIFVVPNNCLGNDECNEHYQKFNHKTFMDLLSPYYNEITITTFTDEFGKIRLPCLMAVCNNNEDEENE